MHVRVSFSLSIPSVISSLNHIETSLKYNIRCARMVHQYYSHLKSVSLPHYFLYVKEMHFTSFTSPLHQHSEKGSMSNEIIHLRVSSTLWNQGVIKKD